MLNGQNLLSIDSPKEVARQHTSKSPVPNIRQERPSSVCKISNLVEGGDRAPISQMTSITKICENLDPHYLHPPRPYNQLLTPQSPGNFGQYLPNASYTPHSPMAHSPHSPRPFHTQSTTSSRLIASRSVREEGWGNSSAQQTATPESSPFARTRNIANAATPRYNPLSPRLLSSTPKDKHRLATYDALEAPSPLAPAHHISSSSTSSTANNRSPHLSSPFMAKVSTTNQPSQHNTSVCPRPQSYTPEPKMQENTFNPPTSASSRHSDPPRTPRPKSIASPPRSPPRPAAGGEMERIRQAMIHDRLVHFQEAESRRPEYMKREKRTLLQVESTTPAEDQAARQTEPISSGVGVMESPMKGRRLKLFQETSEESFEESLMAGGYGRYRTADWVRQPQPMPVPTPGTSSIVSVLEKIEEPSQPTEKELKKRKRLAAFRDGPNVNGSVMATRLHPVELEGRGRVLLDLPAEGEDTYPVDASPAKRRAAARRKKKGELSARDKKSAAQAVIAAGELPDKPNWPDAEFPWRLRTEERAEEMRAAEAEKLKWIERFLDRDSDDEDVDDGSSSSSPGIADEMPPVGPGRGKMVPIQDRMRGNRGQIRGKSSLFPTDPADARAALMSKKRVRTLSYRQQKRRRLDADDDSDDEVLCICNGKDDGRELVQCDDCETWYHLQCIGIHDIAELGKEEDPWFCRRCEAPRRSPSSELELCSEPTFVPTDERPRVSPSYDAPFFQPTSVQDSPMVWDTRAPRTPPHVRGLQHAPEPSSSSTWIDSSRHRPSTPHYTAQDVRVYNNTPGPFDNYSHRYDESPFDPTSTPTRGIKFGPHFATPKNHVWTSRTNGLFQTPKTGVYRTSSNKSIGGPGSLEEDASDQTMVQRRDVSTSHHLPRAPPLPPTISWKIHQSCDLVALEEDAIRGKATCSEDILIT